MPRLLNYVNFILQKNVNFKIKFKGIFKLILGPNSPVLYIYIL